MLKLSNAVLGSKIITARSLFPDIDILNAEVNSEDSLCVSYKIPEVTNKESIGLDYLSSGIC